MAANPDFAVSSPTLPPGFSRGGVGSGCAGSDCGSSLDYSSDEEYFSTGTSRPLTQKSGMEENRKRSRSVEKEEEQRREAKKKKKRLFDQKQQEEEEDEAGDDMSNDQKSLSLSSMGVGCCETLRHHISSGCAVPLCFLFVPLFLRWSRMHYQDVGIYIRPSTDCLLND